MGALLTLPISLLNFLLPFTKPGTPLAQDIVHTAVLCGTLYYAPQIAEWYNARQHRDAPPDAPDEDTIHQPGADPATANPPPRQRQREDLPLDERLVLQPSDDEDDAQPPPSPRPRPSTSKTTTSKNRHSPNRTTPAKALQIQIQTLPGILQRTAPSARRKPNPSPAKISAALTTSSTGRKRNYGD
ncbi:hypothetical protein JI435_020640 [Parastagonospora nodorum SN15]|uniref:Uncharacterized protein n=1 Tax=Phaeosphaeria nodorum (strain SN15 / ATCC MYA-4574 / FGSC 10173) TaxID=321614 RepID=A0A7U2ESH2_PHANO|nr:hypothetical protein JI435_020640 [Parastagonospora nodorum SN15]